MLTPEDIQTHLSKCLGVAVHSILEIRELRDRSGREILDCRYRVGGVTERSILKAYHKGCDDDSELGVARLARKAHLSSLELARDSIRIPRVFGWSAADDLACVVMERLEPAEWHAKTRVEAAGVLARLHNTPLNSLSNELQRLVRDSKPNRDRGRLGVVGRSKFLDKKYPRWRGHHPELSKLATEIAESVEPVSSWTTLVHGDYFSVNLIPTAEGLYVIDWDLLALGDPMWDLGMLVGADSGIGEKEIEEVIRVYKSTRQIDEDVLLWQLSCWTSLRELMRLMQANKEANQ